MSINPVDVFHNGDGPSSSQSLPCLSSRSPLLEFDVPLDNPAAELHALARLATGFVPVYHVCNEQRPFLMIIMHIYHAAALCPFLHDRASSLPECVHASSPSPPTRSPCAACAPAEHTPPENCAHATRTRPRPARGHDTSFGPRTLFPITANISSVNWKLLQDQSAFWKDVYCRSYVA